MVTRYLPTPAPPRRRPRRPLRQIASRSASLLREALQPSRVLAWLCPRCGRWVPPRRFCAISGLCRSCTRHLAAAERGRSRG